MSLKSRIEGDFQTALKSRDRFTVGVLRMVKAEVKNREIENGGELDDDGIVSVISSYAKKRREAAALFAKGGRPELAQQEEQEAELLKKYLPAQLSDGEVRDIVKSIIEKLDSPDIKQMGLVMKAVMAEVGKSADGKRVNAVVRELLQGPIDQ